MAMCRSFHACSGTDGECRDLTAVPAQLWSQIVHINLDLLQGLPVQRLQPYALHKPLHAYPGDACNDSNLQDLTTSPHVQAAECMINTSC